MPTTVGAGGPRALAAALALLACVAALLALAPRARAAPPAELFTAGLNEAGQLGIGTHGEEPGPGALVPGLAPEVVAAAAGEHATYALLANGSVWASGRDKFDELGDGGGEDQDSFREVPLPSREATQIAAGREFALALLANGTVAAWGNGRNGELGLGISAGERAPVLIPTLSHVTQVAAGCYFGLALLSNGTVEAWGWGSHGEIGVGKPAEATEPVTIPELHEVVAVAAGCYTGYALLASGEVRAWGNNEEGELGVEEPLHLSLSPVTTIAAPSNVVKLAAGEDFALALHSDGSLSGWGFDGFGELGDGPEAPPRRTPTPLTAWPAGISSIATSAYDSYAIAGGSAYGAGWNTYRELADGSRIPRPNPEHLSSIPGTLAFGQGNSNFDMLAIEGSIASLSAQELGFAPTTVGATAAAQALVLANHGPSPLVVSGDVLTGPGAGQFAKVGDSCQGHTLAPGTACIVEVAFAPNAPGLAQASLALATTASDALGAVKLSGTGMAPAGPGAGGGPGGVAPHLGDLRLSRRAFRAARSGPSASAAARPGTVVTYSDSQSATATFAVHHAVRGVLVGHGRSRRCVQAPAHPRRGAARCTAQLLLGTFTHADSQGTNKLRFSGRVDGRRLAPGTYTLLAWASARGLRSQIESVHFLITR